METPEKKLKKIALTSALVWAISYIACMLIVKKTHPPMAVSIGLAVLLVLGFAWFLYNHIRRIAAMDELQRRTHLEGTAVAFCINLLVTMVMSILQSVGKLDAGVIGFQELVPLYTLTYVGGLLWARKRYS
jgi:hypothetical protein